MGEVAGLVSGAFGEASQATHDLIHHMAVSRVQVAGPQLSRKGFLRTEKAELALVTSFLRRTISICGVKGQASSLLGRLEMIGPGTETAARRRAHAVHLEQRWGNVRRAHALSVQQGRAILRRGHFKVN